MKNVRQELEPRKETILIMVSAVIRNQEGSILLLKRSNANKTFQGLWQLPEGKIESGESPEEALKRELKEELNLSIIRAHLLGACVERFSIENNNYIALRTTFLTETKGEIQLSQDHDEYAWFPHDACFRNDLLPGTIEPLYTFVFKK